MNALFLLMGLLALSYIGSLLVGERRIRGFGLPSGAEYVIVGFVLGPSALDLLDRPMLESFDPIAYVGLGWVAVVLGLGFGVHRSVEAAPRYVLLGGAGSVFTAAVIGVATWAALGRLTDLRGEPRLLVAAGSALACAETTRESVRWVTERYGASGPLSRAVSVMAETDHVAPLLGLGVCFSVGVTAHLPWAMSTAAWAGTTVALGIAFGATAALMIGRTLSPDETWGTLLGVSVLGTGITTLLGLSAQAAMFVMGIAVATFSGQRRTLLEMVEPTERAVLHPLLLLAGARIDVHVLPALPILAAVVLAARTVGKSTVGGAWQALSPAARRAGPLLGVGFLSAGTLCIGIGLAFALRFPGVVGGTVLAVAAASTLFGELLGPFSLRSSLRAAGEITDAPLAEARGEGAR